MCYQTKSWVPNLLGNQVHQLGLPFDRTREETDLQRDYVIHKLRRQVVLPYDSAEKKHTKVFL
jgi:hypothetical protein